MKENELSLPEDASTLLSPILRHPDFKNKFVNELKRQAGKHNQALTRGISSRIGSILELTPPQTEDSLKIKINYLEEMRSRLLRLLGTLAEAQQVNPKNRMLNDLFRYAERRIEPAREMIRKKIEENRRAMSAHENETDI